MLLRNRLAIAAAVAGGMLLSSTAAFAHVSVTKVGTAGTSQVITFGVGHGCEGLDTVKIEVKIPEEVTTVRALPSTWGNPVINRNDADLITSVVWSKAESLPGDDMYYQFGLRVAVPNAPFTTLLFPTTQTCLDAEGAEVVVEWAAPPTEGEAHGGEEEPPAPALLVLPARVPGWNKYTVEDKVTDLAYFADAQIVWSGDAAYSANPATAELIEGEDDVTELTEIAAGAEIWVKY